MVTLPAILTIPALPALPATPVSTLFSCNKEFRKCKNVPCITCE